MVKQLIRNRKLIRDEDFDIEYKLHSKSILLTESGQEKVLIGCQKYLYNRIMTY